MFKGINPFAGINSPNHFLYMRDIDVQKESLEIYNKIKDATINENGTYPTKATIHAMLMFLQSLLHGWRDQKSKETIELAETYDEQITAHDLETIRDEICYTQYTQVLTHMLWQLPVDISKEILKICLWAQERRDRLYFGDQENEENKDLS